MPKGRPAHPSAAAEETQEPQTREQRLIRYEQQAACIRREVKDKNTNAHELDDTTIREIGGDMALGTSKGFIAADIAILQHLKPELAKCSAGKCMRGFGTSAYAIISYLLSPTARQRYRTDLARHDAAFACMNWFKGLGSIVKWSGLADLLSILLKQVLRFMTSTAGAFPIGMELTAIAMARLIAKSLHFFWTHNRAPNLGMLLEDFRQTVIGVGSSVVFAGLVGQAAPVFAIMAAIAVALGFFMPARPCLRFCDVWNGFLGAIGLKRLGEPQYLVPADLQADLVQFAPNMLHTPAEGSQGSLYVYPVIFEDRVEEYRLCAGLIRQNPIRPHTGQLTSLSDLTPCYKMQVLLAEFVQEFGLELAE